MSRAVYTRISDGVNNFLLPRASRVTALQDPLHSSCCAIDYYISTATPPLCLLEDAGFHRRPFKPSSGDFKNPVNAASKLSLADCGTVFSLSYC